jgi:hypothetical protein
LPPAPFLPRSPRISFSLARAFLGEREREREIA